MKRKNNKNKLLYDPMKKFEKIKNRMGFFSHEEQPKEESNEEKLNNEVGNNNLKNEKGEETKKTTNFQNIKQAATSQMKDIVKEKIKGAAKQKAKSLALKVALKNPVVLGIIAAVIFLFLIIMIFLMAMDKDSQTGMLMHYYRENKAYWWPVGSLETEIIDGIEFASGTPSVTYISSPYGNRANPTKKGAIEFHGGIDIAGAPDNTHPIIAVKEGTIVTLVKGTEGYGNYITIDHGNNEYTLYAHLSPGSIQVEINEFVQQGQVLAKMGTSGRSTGVHLHFEIRLGGNTSNYAVNPIDYISSTNPRPVPLNYELDSSSVSLYETNLTKSEFNAYLGNYHETLAGDKKTNFYTNFLTNADVIYDTAVENDLNPEIVVIFAAIESGFAKCGIWHNFWGIGIANGQGCNSGAHITSMKSGVNQLAKLIHNYNKSSSDYYKMIMNRNEERKNANCNPNGYGTPNTLSGILSIYGWFGTYLANPGSWGDGGCKYIEYWKNTGFLKETYTEEYYQDRCGSHYSCASSSGGAGCVPTTICEQSDYTYYIVKVRLDYRKIIFGL